MLTTEARAVVNVIKGIFINEGKISDKLAQVLQKYLVVKYALLNSNTVSLFQVLKAVRIGVCDEVIGAGFLIISLV